MSPHQELLAALAYIRDRTGDPNAWQTGLTPQEVAAVVSPATRPEQLQAVLVKIRTQHPGLFGTGTPDTRPPQNPTLPPDREQGTAADAIARAEEALAQQNTASSQLDMQVISAILNAHRTSLEGGQALTALQREVEAAVHTRSDLDTPAGARDFQRFLIGKLRDIRAIVLDASLDDTSKSALMAAWTSLYDASRNEADSAGEQTSTDPADAYALDDPDADWDPASDPLPLDEPALPAPRNEIPPTAVAPAAPTSPSLPGFGAGSLPGLGTAPGAMGGWGLPLPALQDAGRPDPPLPERNDGDGEKPLADEQDPEPPDDRPENAAADIEPAAAGPTPVTLPDGETVMAGSPQLAAAIKAAVAGVPIADAFRQQGITIPAPGTPVPDPVDPQRLAPGDVGIFTDRHALALSPGKALVDGQIQHIATVSGPSFLGWEHPPGPAAVSPATEPVTPTPTRPATAPTTAQPKPAGPPGGA